MKRFKTVNKPRLDDSMMNMMDSDSQTDSKIEEIDFKKPARIGHGTILASLKPPPFREDMIDPVNLDAQVTNNSKLPISSKDAKLIYHQEWKREKQLFL